jgi:hypothetical protein
MHRRLQRLSSCYEEKSDGPSSSVQSSVIGPASGEHLVIDKGSPIYNEIDTKKLEQNPPDFTVTFTENKNGFSAVARLA